MNTTSRARRILSALDNFRVYSGGGEELGIFKDAGLGDLIGFYCNPGTQAVLVGVFVDGLSWFDKNLVIRVQFSEILEASLIDGKESEGILLATRDGRQLNLPIKGVRGRFYDSMEVLRFVDRAMQDLKDDARAGLKRSS